MKRKEIMYRTSIEWVKNPNGTQGYSWNPITGCLNNTNGLCNGGGFPCYAWKLANGRLRSRYLANKNIASVPSGLAIQVCLGMREMPNEYEDPFHPRFWPERMRKPIDTGRPSGIFVCDMSDLFGIGVPHSWQTVVFKVIEACPQHRFYLLTKQYDRMSMWSPFPDNCWVGMTATSSKEVIEACRKMRDIKATLKFLSIEPMLDDCLVMPSTLALGGIDWLIFGAQTKPLILPDYKWLKDMVTTGGIAKCKIFLKDSLKPLCPDPDIIRQEMPSCQ